VISDVIVTKEVDKASPKLFLECLNAKNHPKVELELCRSEGGGEQFCYMKIEMEDVVISSVRPGGTSGGGDTLPLEEVGLNYAKITYTYTDTGHGDAKSGGKTEARWDVTKNKGS
jgi:type VI secretion system secreted protein Hcp